MPVAPEEVLGNLAVAVEDAKEVLRELRSEAKGQREAIRHQIQAEAREATNEVRREVEAQMVREAKQVITRLEQDWRQKLGLD